jgi:hypothetical protein
MIYSSPVILDSPFLLLGFVLTGSIWMLSVDLCRRFLYCG